MRRLMGFAVLVGVVLALGAMGASADTASANIQVTTQAAAQQPACTPAAQKDATATTSSSASKWVLTIHANKPICEPVTAAIYSMPNNVFWPWPQQKIESVAFDVPAGTTTVSFTKICGSTQFDVVTGATPDRIQPTTGPMHGPLLFTLNPWSATQNFQGPNTSCTTTTTTTGVTTTMVLGSTTLQTTSTVPATSSTSSTVPASTSVLGATTINSTTTTNYYAPAEVKPATETRAVAPARAGLAATGFNSQVFGIIGLLLITAGVLARRFSDIRNR